MNIISLDGVWFITSIRTFIVFVLVELFVCLKMSGNMNVEKSHYFLNNGSLWYFDKENHELVWCDYVQNLDDSSIYPFE